MEKSQDKRMIGLSHVNTSAEELKGKANKLEKTLNI